MPLAPGKQVFFPKGFEQNSSCCFRPLPPPSVGGLDLNSSSSGCARLGSRVVPPLGVVKEEMAVLIVLVRRHRRAVDAAAWMMRSRARLRRKQAQPRCAVCAVVFLPQPEAILTQATVTHWVKKRGVLLGMIKTEQKRVFLTLGFLFSTTLLGALGIVVVLCTKRGSTPGLGR